MRFISTLCAVALMTPVVGVSQVSPPEELRVDTGSKVRIAAPVFGPKKQVGTVVSLTRDTLVLRQGSSMATRSVATSDITALEVANGKHSRKAKGALWGTLLGAGAGAILGYTLYKEPSCSNPNGFGCINFTVGPTSAGSNAAFSAVGGGILGAVIGTLFGSRDTDSWVPGTVGVR